MVPESQWEDRQTASGESASPDPARASEEAGGASQAGAASQAAKAPQGEDLAPAGEAIQTEGEAQTAEEPQPVSAANYQVYVVNPGETLYGICFKLYQSLGHLDEICRVNGLTDQNSIYAGQELLVP